MEGWKHVPDVFIFVMPHQLLDFYKTYLHQQFTRRGESSSVSFLSKRDLTFLLNFSISLANDFFIRNLYGLKRSATEGGRTWNLKIVPLNLI